MEDNEIQKWAEWFDENDDAGMEANSKDFLKSPDKYKYLEKYRDDIRSVPNAPEISKIPSLEKTLNTLMEDYSSIDEIPKAYLKKKLEEDKVSVDELKNAWLNKQSKDRAIDRIDEEQKEREYRRKELEDLPWYMKSLMTEQAKRRYIDDPESSVFYQEKKAAEGDTTAHPWTKTWLDRAGVGLGAMGAVADLLPGAGGVFVGPTIRGIRSVAEKTFGDDDRPIRSIISDVATDYGSNIGVDYAPTAILNVIKQRSKAMKADLSSNWLDYIWEGGVKETAKKMKKDLDELKSLTKESLLKQEKIREAQPGMLKTLRESGIRTQAEGNVERKFANDISGNAFGNDVKELAEREGISELEASQKYLDKMKRTDKPYDTYQEAGGKPIIIETPSIAKAYKEHVGKQASKYIETQAMADAAGLGGDVAYGIQKGFGLAGPRVVKETGVATREYDVPKSKFDKESKLKKLGLHKESKSDEYQNMLDEIIESTSKQWDAGFIPNNVPGDPMYEAYLKYKRGK